MLDGLKRRAVSTTGELQEYQDDTVNFDNLDDEVLDMESNDVTPLSDGTLEQNVATEGITPEHRPLHIPSTCLNIDHPLSKLELRLCQYQANRYIMAL